MRGLLYAWRLLKEGETVYSKYEGRRLGKSVVRCHLLRVSVEPKDQTRACYIYK